MKTQKAHEKKLKNGLRIITVPMEDNPTVTVLVMVEAGTRYETHATNGLSHFLEHMCFKGTEKREAKQIAYELEAMGAVTNAFTAYDYTGYYAKGRADLFPRLLDVVSDVYLNSTFPEAEIEKERGVICGEIDMYEDLPQRAVHDLFVKSIFGDQPAGYTILGPKENMKRFTRADFAQYHKDRYVAEKTIVVVAGNITQAESNKLVSEAFKTIKTGKVIRKKKIDKAQAMNPAQKIMIKSKKTDQSHLVIGMPSLPVGHKDRTAFEVLIGVLGLGMSSRLFTKLREEMGAGYYLRGVVGYTQDSDDTSDLNISTGTEPKRVPEVISAIMGEMKRLKTEPVPLHELKKVQESLVGRIYMGLEASDDVAFHTAHYAILHQPLKTPKQIEQETRKITVADLTRVAKQYLTPEKMHLALIGPHDNSLEIEKALC